MEISVTLEKLTEKFTRNRSQVWTETVSVKGDDFRLCVSISPIVAVPNLPRNPLLSSTPTLEELSGMIDHTLLKPEATPAQIQQLCREARENQFASVCINPAYVPQAVLELKNSTVPVCTVVGFPLGNTLPAMKALETHLAVAAGAREIDMVIHVGQLKSGNATYVREDIQAVVAAAGPGVLVKVILETCLLTNAEIVLGCQLAQQAGAHFVKTSTGFNKAGATPEHIALMRKTVGDKMGVKAAGGIRDYETALKMIKAGASRIGASASVEIVKGGK